MHNTASAHTYTHTHAHVWCPEESRRPVNIRPLYRVDMWKNRRKQYAPKPCFKAVCNSVVAVVTISIQSENTFVCISRWQHCLMVDKVSFAFVCFFIRASSSSSPDTCSKALTTQLCPLVPLSLVSFSLDMKQHMTPVMQLGLAPIIDRLKD